jgi:hypothetical protein
MSGFMNAPSAINPIRPLDSEVLFYAKKIQGATKIISIFVSILLRALFS